MTTLTIDLGTDDPAKVVSALRDAAAEPGVGFYDAGRINRVASRIREQSALITPPVPPRMAEPAWGEQVIAHTLHTPARRRFVRYNSLGHWGWHDDSSHPATDWADLIEPVNCFARGGPINPGGPAPVVRIKVTDQLVSLDQHRVLGGHWQCRHPLP